MNTTTIGRMKLISFYKNAVANKLLFALIK